MWRLQKVCVQRSAKKYANFAKVDPGKARQRIEARAGTNFSQPRTSFLADLCTFGANHHLPSGLEKSEKSSPLWLKFID